MRLELVIEQFCSQSKAYREQRENATVIDLVGCSRHSLCSQENFVGINSQIAPFVAHCCVGLNVEPLTVINKLLDEGNKREIAHDEIPEEALRAFIKMWVEDGCPNCNLSNSS
ncbi:MAG: hypothetical protein JSS07_07220 [Proteobacteria bacterium]|nr:hypothetical protein [Pseudomonadota bacterium]